MQYILHCYRTVVTVQIIVTRITNELIDRILHCLILLRCRRQRYGLQWLAGIWVHDTWHILAGHDINVARTRGWVETSGTWRINPTPT